MDNQTTIDKNKLVDFSYPEGFAEAAASLDFLPDEAMREQMLHTLASMLQ